MVAASAWKVVAASARGVTRELRDEMCQDAHAYITRGDRFVGVVCDGAGTARFAHHGAIHGVRTVTEMLGQSIGDAGQPLPENTRLRDLVVAAIERTRDTVLQGLSEPAATLTDCNATLVGCVCGPGGGLFFHIGDGAGIALVASSLETKAVSAPENGEFAEQTFFYTGDTWRDHLRFTDMPSEVDLIALMSDGTMTFCLGRGQQAVDLRFFEPVTRFLSRDDVTVDIGSEALHTTLSSSGARRTTNDDNTLLWARRYPLNSDTDDSGVGEPE